MSVQPVLRSQIDPLIYARPCLPSRGPEMNEVEQWFADLLEEVGAKWQYERVRLNLERERPNPADTEGITPDFRVSGDDVFSEGFFEITVGANKQTLGQKRRKANKAYRFYGIPFKVIDRNAIARIQLDPTELLRIMDPAPIDFCHVPVLHPSRTPYPSIAAVS